MAQTKTYLVQFVDLSGKVQEEITIEGDTREEIEGIAWLSKRLHFIYKHPGVGKCRTVLTLIGKK
jgi:hypothetical protein